MDALEKKRLQMRLKQVDAQIAELEFKIEERLADIERIKEHIEKQKELELEIKEKLELN